MHISLILNLDKEMPVSVFLRLNVHLILCPSYLNHYVHFALIKWELGSRKSKDLCLPVLSLYSPHRTFESSKFNLSQHDDESKEADCKVTNRFW